MKSDNIELFTAYLEKDLTNADRQSFEKRLTLDVDFNTEFKEFQDVYNILENQFSKERLSVLDSIQAARTQFERNSSSSGVSRKVFPFKPWQMGVAASILLVIGLFFFNNSGKPTYSDFAIHDAIVLTVRSETDSISKNAETKFNSGNYQQAIVYFDALLKQSPQNIEIELYKAIAQIETNDFISAEKLLQAISRGNSVYVSNALYWHALSKLKQKKYSEAKSILLNISSESEEYSKAQKLLSKL